MAAVGPLFVAGHQHAPKDACNEAGGQCGAPQGCEGDAPSLEHHHHTLSPIKTEVKFVALRDASDAGGAISGHSDTTYQALLPASATAAAAELTGGCGLAQREPASPDSVVTAPKPAAAGGSPVSAAVIKVPELVPLPPPDASEGPEAAAEYEIYLQRWDAGDTLAQRWHRLAQCGKLSDIQADWDDWQLDLMLTDVRARAQAAAATTQQRPGAVTPSVGGGGNGGSSRPRRGRAEVEEANDSQPDEPRRVRSRRAPSTLQDYHLENTPGRTPERQQEAADAAAAADPADPVSDDSTDEPPYSPAGGQQQQQQAQARPAGLPRGGGGPAAFQQAAASGRRPSSRLQRHNNNVSVQPQQQQQQPRTYGRIVSPYSPAAAQMAHQQAAQLQLQAQMAVQARAQYAHQQRQQQAAQMQLQMQLQLQQQQQQQQPQQMMAAMQQLMAQLQHNGSPLGGQQQQGGQQVSPEMTELWFKIGSALGAMMQEKGGPANLLTNPQAMSAMVDAVLRQTTGDPDAAMQQLVATMAASHAAL